MAAWRTVLLNKGGAVATLVHDADVPRLIPEPLHPAYPYLSYVHRADYMRMELLHAHGGLWLDLETVALRNFSSLFRRCRDDGVSVPSNQGVIGPLRPNTTLTRAWRERVHRKLDSVRHNLQQRPGGSCSGNHCGYGLGWQAILGNVWRELNSLEGFKPVAHKCLKTCEYGCPIACYDRDETKCEGADLAQGKNAGVSSGFKQMSEADFTLRSPGVMAQMVRHALGIELKSEMRKAISSHQSCLTLAEANRYRNASAKGEAMCPPVAHPGFSDSHMWLVGDK